MLITQLVPARQEVDLDVVLERVEAGSPPSEPFAPSTIRFFEVLGQRLATRVAAAFPDVRALAFWMRSAHLALLKEQFEAGRAPGTLSLPRGLVFHVPPANVGTIFMYSWLLAALSGNRSVIRLSGSRGPVADAICDVINETMANPDLADGVPSSAIVTYGHDANVTAALSSRADVRVIWGGDATVTQIRAVPLPPRAVEITFADRYSFAAIDANAYLNASELTRAQLAEDFVSDLFPFDQAACSSPQLVAWRGSEADVATAADAFFGKVAESAARRGYAADASVGTMQTVAAATIAIEHRVHRCKRYGHQLLVVELASDRDFAREIVGGGYLLSLRMDDLDQLAPHLTRRDQTLTAFGFDGGELERFARDVAALGAIDRIVPIGQALGFDRFWDGYDLLSAMTRTVQITPDPRFMGDARTLAEAGPPSE